MKKNTLENPNFRFEIPGKIFKLAGEIKTRVPESDNLYQGNPQMVPEIMKRIFPDINFSQLEPKQVYILLKKTNPQLKRIDLSCFNDSATTNTVTDTLSMAFRTSHPLAINRTKKEMVDILTKSKKHFPRKEFSMIDIGYGPGTISMVFYDLAKQLGFKPSLTGVDSASVHQAIATYLYPPQKHNVKWTNENGINYNPKFENQFQVGTAFDVGHHLNSDDYRLLVKNLLDYSSNEVLITDPTNNQLARLIVSRITHKDKIHHEAINSFTAAYSRHDLANLFGEIIKNNQKKLKVNIVNTGFMNIIRLRCQTVQGDNNVI